MTASLLAAACGGGAKSSGLNKGGGVPPPPPNVGGGVANPADPGAAAPKIEYSKDAKKDYESAYAAFAEN